MALPGEIGWIGKPCPECGRTLKASIMHSGAGYYIGTECPCGPGPMSRESGYYPTRKDAQNALVTGTVSWRDTQYHGPMTTEG